MLPEPVDHQPREPRIIWRRYPVSENDAWISGGQSRRDWCVESPRGDFQAAVRNGHVTISGVVNQHAVFRERLSLQSIEESRETVVVLLRPFLEGVMVALRA